MEKAIVLLSGGMNSAVAAAEVAQSHELCMVFANFYQRSLIQEMGAYEALCRHFEVKHHWKVELSHFKQVGGNALVDLKRDIEDAQSLEQEVPGTYVAALMPTLLDVAAAFAFRISAKEIIIGVSEALEDPPPGSAALYPDNRREFIQNYQYMLDSALPQRSAIALRAPLISYDRGEIVKLGQRLKVPFEMTWSCYQEGEAPCGSCFGCVSRAAGFLQAGIPDPLVLTSAQQS